MFDTTNTVDLTSYALAGSSRETGNRTAPAIGRAQQADELVTSLLLVHRNKRYRYKFTEAPGGRGATRGDDGWYAGWYAAAGVVAEWKGGWYSGARNRFEFSKGSAHSAHAVTMTTGSYVLFREGFIVDSASFE
jgi:hypothetical protein